MPLSIIIFRTIRSAQQTHIERLAINLMRNELIIYKDVRC